MKKLSLIILLSFIITCSNKQIKGKDLSKLGFYSSPANIINKLKDGKENYREHFMLGIAYQKNGNHKKAILHYANSCFKYRRKMKLKLYPFPVYKFVRGFFHFKSEYYDNSIYEIASLFYLYREYEYVVKFINLIRDKGTAVYRDGIILKARALVELKKSKEAITNLNKILKGYEDTNSKSAIHIRIASIYEREEDCSSALQEYLKIIKLNQKSWQSEIASSRIIETYDGCDYNLNHKERTLLSTSLYNNSRYKESIKIIEDMQAKAIGTQLEMEVNELLIKSYVRIREIGKANLLINKYKKTSALYYKLLKIKADELWDARRKHNAVKVYKKLLSNNIESIPRDALKRVALFMQDRRVSGFTRYLKEYIRKYPNNRISEYFLWLLAKERIRRSEFKAAMGYLERAITKFPDGAYSGRNRFWLYKILIREKRHRDAATIIKDLVVRNPDSSYTWTLIERINKKYSIQKLEESFSSSIESKNVDNSLYYHTLLFFIERDLGKRDSRIKSLDFAGIRAYSDLENDIKELKINSKYNKIIRGLDKYFAIGNIEGINRDIGIIPDDEESDIDKKIALAHYGDLYNNHYLALASTAALLKHKNLKENFAILPVGSIKKLLPRAFINIVEESSAKKNLEKEVVYAMMKAESAFNHRAVSSAGAVGLMQIMPNTAKGIARDLKVDNYDLTDPLTSIIFGTQYLHWLEYYFKSSYRDSFEMIVAGYNAGAGNVKKWQKSQEYEDIDYFVEFIPFDETRGYVLKTRRFFIQYKLIMPIMTVY
ncbi:MAG: transglycosylase SLT domain-containing protein [Spirochaetota bacterium]|nr:transglycosylase SLT domain-containing protein [Spirochaetota bacterium]